MRLRLPNIPIQKIRVHSFLHLVVGPSDGRSRPGAKKAERASGRGAQDHRAATRGPSPTGERASPRASFLRAGWQRVKAWSDRIDSSWIGDWLGGLSLAALLVMLTFMAGAFSEHANPLVSISDVEAGQE